MQYALHQALLQRLPAVAAIVLRVLAVGSWQRAWLAGEYRTALTTAVDTPCRVQSTVGFILARPI